MLEKKKRKDFIDILHLEDIPILPDLGSSYPSPAPLDDLPVP